MYEKYITSYQSPLPNPSLAVKVDVLWGCEVRQIDICKWCRSSKQQSRAKSDL